MDCIGIALGIVAWSSIMLDEQFRKQRARLVRDLAEKADPFIKRRLIDLAARYDRPQSNTYSEALATTDMWFVNQKVSER